MKVSVQGENSRVATVHSDTIDAGEIEVAIIAEEVKTYKVVRHRTGILQQAKEVIIITLVKRTLTSTLNS